MEKPAGRWIGFLNPGAQRLKRAAARAGLIRALARRGIKTLELPPDPAARTAAIGAPDIDGVVVCGGDGSVAAAVNALDLDRQTLAVTPFGRGNCVARDLDCGTFARALRALDAQRLKRIDLIEIAIDGAPPVLAANAVACGRLADVVVNATRFRALGDLGYTLAGLLSRTEAQTYRVSIDGGPPQEWRVSGILVQNTRFLGRYEPYPGVASNDGAFDVSTQPPGLLAEKGHELRLALTGRFGMPVQQARRVEVEASWPVSLYLDGEVVPAVERFAISVRPGALRCIAGARA